MKKNIIILLLMAISILPLTYALEGKVAFISSNPSRIDYNFWNELENLGLNVEWVDSDFIAYKDMTSYDMMFVNNEFFYNANLIPVNQMPTLLVTSWNLDVWNWAFTSSSIASNSPLKVNITNSNSPIISDYNYGDIVTVYDSCCEGQLNLQMQYLARLDRTPFPKKYPGAPILDNLMGLEIDIREGAVLTAIAGTELRNGAMSQSKGAFFGITEVKHWTNHSRKLFGNTVAWLLTDEYAPIISNINSGDITNDTTKVTFITNKLSTSKINYGLSQIFGQQSQNNGLLLNHSYNLTGLRPGSTYYYQIEVCNKFNYCNKSDIKTFQTMKNAPGEVDSLVLSVNNQDNRITLEWSPINGAALYNIYAADNTDSFNFNNPIATVAATSYLDSSSSSFSQRFYVVRAVNDEGTEEKNNNIVGKFDLDLKTGANLISIPLVPFDPSIEKVMHHDLDYNPVVMVKTFADGNFKTSNFDVKNAQNYWTTDELSNIENNKAYYFVAKENNLFTVVGRYSDARQKISLVNGSNYFGLTSLSTFALDEIFLQDPSNYRFVEVSRRNAEGNFEVSTYYPINGWFSAAEFGSLEPGKGYIVNTNAQVDLEYDP